jgi:hypothetical protein
MSKRIFAEFTCDITKNIFDTKDQNNYVTMVYKVIILFLAKQSKKRGENDD